MGLRSQTIQRWWPTTQSLDLVEGWVEQVAEAVHTELSQDGELTTFWESFQSLDSAFEAATEFTNVPTFFLVLPTQTKWSVLWNNSYGCDGYDSLCWNLTKNHGFPTIHWTAHNKTTTFQPGATFIHRYWNESVFTERYVQVLREDKRWLFLQEGEPLLEEEISAYTARLKRDRLNERKMSELLGRLGAFPWQDEFYALPLAKTLVLRRVASPNIYRKEREEVLSAGQPELR